MEKVIHYFTRHKKILLLSCLLLGCILIFFNSLYQIVVLAAVGALAIYFCKTFENKMLALFVTLYAIIQIALEIFHINLAEENLLVWSVLAIIAGTIQGIRKKDKVYIVLVGALLMWLVSKWFHLH